MIRLKLSAFTKCLRSASIPSERLKVNLSVEKMATLLIKIKAFSIYSYLPEIFHGHWVLTAQAVMRDISKMLHGTSSRTLSVFR